MHKRNTLRVLTIVGLILLIPLLGNSFVDGWNWTVIDFIVAAIMLFVTGITLELVFEKLINTTYKIFASLSIIILFTIIWVELATGFLDRLV